jgi:hypothetical protein
MDIFDGAANGNEVSWKVSITDPMDMTLEFAGAIEGDRMSGSVKLGPIDGGVSRIVEFADGAGRIESWKPGVGWVEGGASADEFIGAAPVSSLLARRLGIPLSER